MVLAGYLSGHQPPVLTLFHIGLIQMTFLRVIILCQCHTDAIDVRVTFQDLLQDDLQTCGLMQGLFDVMHIINSSNLHVRQQAADALIRPFHSFLIASLRLIGHRFLHHSRYDQRDDHHHQQQGDRDPHGQPVGEGLLDAGMFHRPQLNYSSKSFMELVTSKPAWP